MLRQFFIFFIGVFIFSCVSNKKVQLFQSQNDTVKSVQGSNGLTTAYNHIVEEYKIQVNDILSIRVESITPEEYDLFRADASNNQLSQQSFYVTGYLVDPDGNIEFPIVGNIAVTGLTIFEIERIIHEKVRNYLNNAVINVRLLNFRFTLLGEVTSPGTIAVYSNQISIAEAIGSGGGPSDLADLSKVKLMRRTGGITNIHYLNLLDEDVLSSSLYFIQSNDVIIIPPLKQRPFRKYFGNNLALVVSSISLILLTINLTK